MISLCEMVPIAICGKLHADGDFGRIGSCDKMEEECNLVRQGINLHDATVAETAKLALVDDSGC